MRRGTLRAMIGVLAVGFLVFAVVVVVAFVRISDVTTQIQDQRRALCVDQNLRHDATIHKLDMLLVHELPHMNAAERRRALASRAGTIVLLNALVPVHDCSAIS